MARIEKSIEIKVPVEKVWAVCSDIEGYPKFMETVKEVKRTGDRTSHWKLEPGGRAMECDAETTEIIEQKRLVWRSTGDFQSEGSWRLEATGEGTRVTHLMDYKLPGIVGVVIDRIKVSKEMEKSMERNLQTMKTLLEGK